MRWWSLGVACVLTAACGGDPGAPSQPGEQVYNRYCFSCHAAGVAGAPRVGDAEAWAVRVEKGHEALLEATIRGMPPGMPPRGLCSACTDEELSTAIDYMIERSISQAQ